MESSGAGRAGRAGAHETLPGTASAMPTTAEATLPRANPRWTVIVSSAVSPELKSHSRTSCGITNVAENNTADDACTGLQPPAEHYRHHPTPVPVDAALPSLH